MRKSSWLVGITMAMALFVSTAPAQEVLSQNVVGYYNITLNGASLNLVAFPFQKIPSARGVITSATQTTITDSGAVWTVGEFNQGVVKPELERGASTFYIEITTGGFEGRHVYVASNTENTLTLAGAGLPADVADPAELNGAAYKIVSANRIRDLFGDPELYGQPGGPVLAGSHNVLLADNIILWGGGSWKGPVHLNTVNIPPTFLLGEWYRGSTVVSDEVVDRDEALFARLRGPGDVDLTIVGEVSDNQQQVVMSQGLNLVGGLAVVPEPLSDTHLTAIAKGSHNVLLADNIIAWGGGSWEAPIHLNTVNVPPTFIPDEWYQGSVNVHDTFNLNPIKGYFVRVRDDVHYVWERPTALPAE